MNTRSPPLRSDGAFQKWLKAAELGRGLVRVEHRRDRVPAHDAPYSPLERLVDGMIGLVLRRDRVQVRRRARRRRSRPGQLRVPDDALQEELGSLRPVTRDDGVERLQPFARLLGIYLDLRCHLLLLISSVRPLWLINPTGRSGKRVP
jgi:hypothetical protein